MTYRGIVQNGVIVIQGGVNLPDGTEVSVVAGPRAEEAGTNSDSHVTTGEKLARFAKKTETQPCDLPEDLADNHDHYLHGMPKREH